MELICGCGDSYETLRHQTRRLCEEAKVAYHGEHVFRHTYTTNCYYKGVNVKVLSKLLGHVDVNVTYNIYVQKVLMFENMSI